MVGPPAAWEPGWLEQSMEELGVGEPAVATILVWHTVHIL